jgi:hypothetical protein
MPEDIIDNPDRAAAAAANRDAMYRLITGQNAGDLREMVRALGGTRAVAQLTGRSQRTVQRWITTTGTERIRAPRADASQAITQAFAQARSTKAGRQRIADTRRATLLRNNGARMRGSAKSGVVTAGGTRAYLKDRVWNHAVGSDVMSKTFDAWIEHGDDAAYHAFNRAFGDDYGGDGAMFDEFMFADMNGLYFTPDTGSS